MDVFWVFLNYCRTHRVQAHIFFWTGVIMLSIGTNYFGYKTWTFEFSFIYALVGLITQMPAAYFLAYFIIPRFSTTKKYISTFLMWLLVAFILSVLSRIVVVYVAEPLTWVLECADEGTPTDQEPVWEIFTDIYKLFKVYFYHTLSIPFVFLTIKLVKDQHTIQERALKLEKEKIATELKLLKAQLNPHFLFNTLNNIYSLSIENSPKTSDAIFRLSEILDYILYRSNHPFVPIKEEAQLIQNYCALERLRYDDRLQFSMQVAIEHDVTVAPLILVSIVENAFKHGASEDTGRPELIITLKATKHHLLFEVMNTVAPGDQTNKQERIGLPNIKQQLDLIYAGKYLFDIVRDKNYFKVRLEIQVNAQQHEDKMPVG